MVLNSSKKSIDPMEAVKLKLRAEYQQFCDTQRPPLFYNPWYLDVTCGNNKWDILLAKKEDKVLGVWPILIRKKYGISYISPPMLTPYLGPWYCIRPDLKGKELYDQEHEILNSLCSQMPKVNLLNAHLHPDYTNWQPLHFNGFTQTTRYTYKIDLKQSKNELWQNIDKRQQQLITTEDQKCIIESDDYIMYYKLLKSTFDRQKLNVPYTFEWFQHLYQILKEKNNCRLYLFQNAKKEAIAGVFIAHDFHSSYLLSTAKDYSIQDNGSIPNLIWYAILKSKIHSNTFDFEGSMIKGVEYFFRSFGGTLSPYLSVLKVNPFFLKIPLTLLGKV